MVPLMVEEDYRATGWLGLLIGTQLYYKFFGADLDEEAVFEHRIHALARALGDRGKPTVLEGVPPAGSPTPRPAAAAAPTAATPRPVAHLAQSSSAQMAERSFSPSMHVPLQPGAPSGSLAELSTFMAQQQTRDEKIKQEMEAQITQLRAEVEAKQGEAITDGELAAFQARMEELRTAQLL